MTKIVLITDNHPDQINGVVTTYDAIAEQAALAGYKIQRITPADFRHISLPVYPDIKISFPHKLYDKIIGYRPDHIHIATEGPIGLIAKIILDRRRIPYTSAYHTKLPEALQQYLNIPEWLSYQYIKWFHSKSHKVLTTTASMVETLKQRGILNAIPWTRGVNREIFYPDRKVTQYKRPILVCVSRISQEKNIEDFLRLQTSGTKILVGDGPKLQQYRSQYKDVEYVGFKRGSELASYYQVADVFVFPSRWDTFGIVMIEAMACGTPVAAYPVQGPKDVIEQHFTGVMDDDLSLAVERCLELDRQNVRERSLRWCWGQAWRIFLQNLSPINYDDR